MPDDPKDANHPLAAGPGTWLGGFKQKLIAEKERWARENRLPRPDEPRAKAPERPRLPPGQRLTKEFPVLDLGVQPLVGKKEWRLTVSGSVERPIDWSWDAFMAQPQVSKVNDIHCVTSWSRYDNEWRGVSAAHLLSVVKPLPEAKFVVLKSHDGYSTNLPLAHFAAPEVLFAHTWEGKPLAREHGGPVRLVVPALYFWKSPKWVRHLTFLEKDVPGFWEVRGYHNVGDPWNEERYG